MYQCVSISNFGFVCFFLLGYSCVSFELAIAALAANQTKTTVVTDSGFAQAKKKKSHHVRTKQNQEFVHLIHCKLAQEISKYS